MSTFNVKLAPKSNNSTDFPNFTTWDLAELKLYNNRIVYMNYSNPGTHIYSAYYIKSGTAHPVRYIKTNEYNTAFFSLNEMSKEDIIIFWSEEDGNKYDAAKKNKP